MTEPSPIADIRRLADALTAIPEGHRAAVLAYVACLVGVELPTITPEAAAQIRELRARGHVVYGVADADDERPWPPPE